jgi:hypothetical protein
LYEGHIYCERNKGAKWNIYFGRHFSWLTYFTYHLIVPVLARTTSSKFCRRLKLEKYVIHWLNLKSSLFIWIYSGGGRVKSMKHLKGGGQL